MMDDTMCLADRIADIKNRKKGRDDLSVLLQQNFAQYCEAMDCLMKEKGINLKQKMEENKYYNMQDAVAKVFLDTFNAIYYINNSKQDVEMLETSMGIVGMFYSMMIEPYARMYETSAPDDSRESWEKFVEWNVD